MLVNLNELVSSWAISECKGSFTGVCAGLIPLPLLCMPHCHIGTEPSFKRFAAFTIQTMKSNIFANEHKVIGQSLNQPKLLIKITRTLTIVYFD